MRISRAAGKNADLWGDKRWQEFMWGELPYTLLFWNLFGLIGTGTDVMKQTADDWDVLVRQAPGAHLENI
jgi:hypothetical protein